MCVCSAQFDLFTQLKLRLCATKSSHAVQYKIAYIHPLSPSLYHENPTTMPKRAKRFASQRPKSTSLSSNPISARTREVRRSRIGFAAEEQRIKIKYRTRLARAQNALKQSAEWRSSSPSRRIEMESKCKGDLESQKQHELESVAAEWLRIMPEESAMNMEVDEEGVTDDNDNEIEVEQEYDDDENYMESSGHDSEYEESSRISHDEIELNKDNSDDESVTGDKGEEEGKGKLPDNSDDEFDDSVEDVSDEDVSDNEMLYDSDGNVIQEQDMVEGFREIMERHMGRLREQLEIYVALAQSEE